MNNNNKKKTCPEAAEKKKLYNTRKKRTNCVMQHLYVGLEGRRRGNESERTRLCESIQTVSVV